MATIVRATAGAVQPNDFYAAEASTWTVPAAASIDEEEMLRARLYALLARLLLDVPDAEMLAELAAADGGDASALGASIGRLARAARAADRDELRSDFDALFVGLSRGELVPFASYYLTGFLNERPLARLRGDMAALGIARLAGCAEPEDHAGALCEMMAGLITGAFGAEPADLATQQRFFDTHLRGWMGRFFADLGAARPGFYGAVGAVGVEFLSVEAAAFDFVGA